MLNLKLLSLCVLAISVVYVLSVGTAGASSAVNDASNLNYKAVAEIKGEQYCPEKGINTKTNETIGTKCSEGSFAHHYECCGSKNGECCFALQLWVYIVMGVLTVLSILSTVLGLICCCCKK